MVTIATIGGGPAAVSFCMQLCEQLKAGKIVEPIQVFVFEKNANIGHGLPYAQQKDHFILNLDKEIMEPAYGQNGTFSKWLAEQSTYNLDTKFPPRHYFGNYLENIATALQKIMKVYGVTIHYYTHQEVSNISKSDVGRIIIESNEKRYEVDYAVLCTGHMPSSTYYEFINQPNYKHNPWSDDSYLNINSNDDICIIGSRLTAIDIALNLKQRKHQGKIIMASRSGLLPAVLANEIPSYTLRYLTLNAFVHLTKGGLESLPLDKLMDLFWKEVSEAEGKLISYNSIIKSSKKVSPLEWLNQQISLAETGVKPWQQVLFAIYPIVPTLWSMLSLQDKKTFQDEYNSIYMTYLAAFPLENAYKVQEMIESNQLEVHGGLTSIQHDNDKFILNVENNHKITVKHLFNATGPGYDPTHIPLYRKMLSSRILQKHPLGGFNVNPQTLQAMNSDGIANDKLFAIGELTRGVCLATTDMSQVANQADRVATYIRQKMNEHKRPVSNNTTNQTICCLMKSAGLFKHVHHVTRVSPFVESKIKSARFFVSRVDNIKINSNPIPCRPKSNIKFVH